MKKKILIGSGILLLLIQLLQIDKTPVEFEKNGDFIATANPGGQISGILKSACYDCHSYETKYPWYTNVAPLSWWIGHHIEEGREHLNFSTWKNYDKKKQDHKLDECIEVLEDNEMPLNPYTWIHPEARLENDEKILLTEWFKTILK